jgi:inner membrane protein
MKTYFIKGLVITGIILALLVPVHLVKSLVTERKDRQDEVYVQMGDAWGSAATVAGIAISKIGNTDIPEQQKIDCEITAETRQKGIFRIPFYTAKMVITATINPADIDPEHDKLTMIMQYSGVVQVTSATLGGKQIAPETNASYGSPNCYSIPIWRSALGKEKAQLRVEFIIKGIDHLYFQQISKSTEINISSNWTDPNFTGAYLPSNRTIDEKGFRAQWKLINPIFSNNFSFDESESFGVGIFIPVGIYKLTDRSIKYAILFIILTFTAFFLFEILNSLRIHPIQYLLVGAALTLFFLLLLSLSEYINFTAAYITASAATIGLIIMYCARIMGNRRRLLITTILLSSLYILLYVLLQIEQYSLILGSIGLFVILGAVMYLTRNIDWYKLSKK